MTTNQPDPRREADERSAESQKPAKRRTSTESFLQRAQLAAARRKRSPVLTGDLSAISLFDIMQMLVLAGRTGKFTVLHPPHRGDFYFSRGHIVSVADDRGNQDMLAAVSTLLWEEGTFEFDQAPVQVTRSIVEGGDAFLLEAARQVDELRETRRTESGASSKGDLSEEATLVLRRRAMENLRDLFTTVTADDPAVKRPTLDLAVLESQPASLGVEAVYLRPGQPAIARRDRHMVPLWPERLSLDDLLSWLRGVLPAELHSTLDSRSDGCCATVRAEDGSWLDLSVFEESSRLACVVRIVAESVEEPEAVGLDPGLLEPLLGQQRGLVILSGPSGRWRSRAFSSLVAMAARQRGGLVVTIEKQRSVRMDDPGQDHGGVAFFQRPGTSPVDQARALAFAREQEADILAANPLLPEVLSDFQAASWPLLVVAAVSGSGAIDGVLAARSMASELASGASPEWLARNLLGVVATGSIRAEQGVRPAAEVLAGGGLCESLIAANRIDELETAFMTGQLPGSISLAQLAARTTPRAA